LTLPGSFVNDVLHAEIASGKLAVAVDCAELHVLADLRSLYFDYVEDIQ
jgi:hypothetical protein